MIPGASPASAACELDGSIPGSGPKVTVVNVGPETFYIDDRDLEDLDSDDQAGGLWIYQETKVNPGLQRGGVNWVILELNPRVGNIPYVAPIVVNTPPVVTPPAGPVNPPDVDPPNPSLFTDGLGGGDLADFAGARDECKTLGKNGKPLPPDKVWF